MEDITHKGDLSSINIKDLHHNIAEIKSNIEILDMVWNKFQSNHIEDLAELEQCFSTGLTSEAANTSSTKLISSLFTILSDTNTEK